MALGMFCGIPLPFRIWDKELMPVMVTCIPLVGVVIGVLWWGLASLLLIPTLSVMMVAAILTVAPFLLAGFIHLDGYMDTSDALFSRRDYVDRVRILKDPLVGAFAVIMVVILFLLMFAAMYSIADMGRYLGLVVAICIISRSCSAFSILTLRHMPESNYGAMLAKNNGTGGRVFVIIIKLATMALSVLYAGFIGFVVVFSVLVGYALAMRTVYKSFKGVSGDLLGYSLVMGELCGFIVLALLQGVDIIWF